jgi:ketosteroid isomerase-like protein
VRKLCVISLMLVVVTAVGCGSNGSSGAADAVLIREAQTEEIDQIEKTFHKATSTKNLDLMMTLFDDTASLVATGGTYTGPTQIRKFFAAAAPFQPKNNWMADTPAFKIRITVDGDSGTLYFECHYVDKVTRQMASVIAADTKVARVNGHWLITKFVGVPTTLG